MFKQLASVAALSAGIFLTACGGGGGSDGGSNPAPQPTQPPVNASNGNVTVQRVAGPLDVVQNQISGSVLGQLGSTAEGTPLEGVLRCADETITYNLVDIADSALVQLQAAATGGGVGSGIDPSTLTANLGSLTANLTQLLQSLAGVGDGCLADVFALDSLAAGTNPLAGTPLAPLGTALAPVLGQIANALGESNRSGEDLQLSTVANLVSQLNTALQLGLSQIPAEAASAPVVGGVLSTLSTTLNDTTALLSAVAAYNGPATGTALQTLVQGVLVNLLTEVVPVRLFEEQAGQPGLISSQIEDGAAQLAALIGTTVGTVTTPIFSSVLGQALAPILDPIENDLLPALLGPLGEALGGLSGGGLGSAGSPLAPVIGVIEGVLGSLLGGLGGIGGGGGTGGGTGGSTCPFAGLPILGILCGIGGN